jgi:hypothetical protein
MQGTVKIRNGDRNSVMQTKGERKRQEEMNVGVFCALGKE